MYAPKSTTSSSSSSLSLSNVYTACSSPAYNHRYNDSSSSSPSSSPSLRIPSYQVYTPPSQPCIEKCRATGDWKDAMMYILQIFEIRSFVINRAEIDPVIDAIASADNSTINKALASADMRTPLIQLCTMLDSVDLCSAFIARGANVNARDKKGYTALHAALKSIQMHHRTKKRAMDEKDDHPRLKETIAVACCLVQNGADIFAEAWHGQTPFHSLPDLIYDGTQSHKFRKRLIGRIMSARRIGLSKVVNKTLMYAFIGCNTAFGHKEEVADASATTTTAQQHRLLLPFLNEDVLWMIARHLRADDDAQIANEKQRIEQIMSLLDRAQNP